MHADPATTPSRQTIRFGPIDVDFDARILVPRPWTLAQSEWAAELAGGSGGPILELCAGAGHIGLAAAVLADRDLVQVDRDPVAVEYAAFNARRAGWAARVEIRRASLEVSRPGNIEKRAGHGRESILWLIRTSRKWREVTAKGNRRAQLPVDLETFLRPESVPAGDRFCGLKNQPAEAVVRCAG